MSTAIVQEDFGGFNPRFPGGVGVVLGSPEAYRVLVDHLADADSFDPDASSLAAVSIRSVIDHEVRHFHDALLSPWGSLMLRLRVMALVNGVQAIRAARDIRGDALPVPIARWLAFDDRTRQSYLEDWADVFGGPLTPLDLPPELRDLSMAALAGRVVDVSQLDAQTQVLAYVAAATQAYADIRTLVTGFAPEGAPAPLRPAMVFEVTALATQLMSILQAQGEAAAVRFLDFLLSAEQPYAEIWRLFTEIGLHLASEEHPGVQPARLVLAAQRHAMRIAMWCLMGNHQLDGPAACPTRRFMVLLEHLAGMLDDPTHVSPDVAHVWDAWDAATSTRPWRDACREDLAASHRALDAYTALADQWHGGEDVPRIVRNVMSRRIAGQDAVRRRLFEDPSVLADPLTYANAPEGTFPMPAMRVECDGFVIVDGPTEVLPGYRPAGVVETDAGRGVSGFVFALDAQSEDEALDDLLAFEDLMCACDLTFSEHTMPLAVFERSREVVQSVSGKRIALIV